MFGSDIGHFGRGGHGRDLEGVYELIGTSSSPRPIPRLPVRERGPAHGGMNPAFFQGTAVEASITADGGALRGEPDDRLSPRVER